jgi:hypothetical protein
LRFVTFNSGNQLRFIDTGTDAGATVGSCRKL